MEDPVDRLSIQGMRVCARDFIEPASLFRGPSRIVHLPCSDAEAGAQRLKSTERRPLL